MPPVIFVFLIPILLVLGIGTGMLRAISRFRMQLNPPSVIQTHIKTLARKRNQLVRTDDYGVEYFKEWHKERAHFVEKVIKPTLSGFQRKSFCEPMLAELIETAISSHALENATFKSTMTPIEYEHYCAEILRQVGWSASVTKASGDQGADVIAAANGVRLLLQCKLHNHAVGNKAVQEASAARVHYGCDYAAVVTNLSYTRSAAQLAASNNVKLLHHDDLLTWAESFLRSAERPELSMLSA